MTSEHFPEVDGQNMGKVFEAAVERFPERVAIKDPDVGLTYTYEEWGEKVEAVASALQASGVDAGDRVSLVAENRWETSTVFWATQQIGATFVPFNFRSAPDEVTFLVDNVDTSVLFFSGVSRDNVLDALSDIESTDDIVYVDDDVPEEATSFESFVDRGDGEVDPTYVDPDDESLILHTSGTTGKPKGVPISHRANYSRTVGNTVNLGWQLYESTLGIMPNFHEMGRAQITSLVLLGGTYIAQRSWSPEQGLQLIQDESISMLYLVPTMVHDMVDYEGVDDYDVSSVRNVGYAGTAMTERVHERVWEVFDPDIFTNFYGSSEMNCMAICNWLDEKPGCAGRAGINTRARVVKPVEGETVSPDNTMPTDELGEIILDAASAEAFDGYLNRPDANETSFEEGWYFTGDLGYRDEDGDLWVVGRVDDMLISGGENIYPVEIEDVLDEHELVGDVAVGAVHDDRWGDRVTAYIEVSGGTDMSHEAIAEELDSFLKETDKLANFKRPRMYVFVSEIPQSQVGKKLRRKLRAEDVADVDAEVLAQIDV